MNLSEDGLTSHVATYPALFNRCILDWFSDWLLPLPPSHRSAVVNAFVFVYKSLYEINVKLRKCQGRYNYITPCYYLDFINHYVTLFNKKRENLKKQKHHLNIGLDKLKIITAVDYYNDLNIKNKELQEKKNEANEKLNQLLEYQCEAKNHKEESEKIMHTLHVQTNQIERHHLIVTNLMNDLANAELAIENSKRHVRDITRQHLTEIRSMNNTYEIVKMVKNSVMIMLGCKPDNWKTVQVFLRNYDDFINNIVMYDVNKMTKNVHSIHKEREDLTDAQKGTQQLVQNQHQMINDLEKKIKYLKMNMQN
ncbi:21547_t:CDS:2 [Gigaspora margarita]|uniref:21547_t:CDS:1 n=1 Tax=Gigaspora margarita TaxID=4874 RepID=A0ABM8W0W0_GIGMA|nr:21547_t:CDS:2 [Gigaspora margarita]